MGNQNIAHSVKFKIFEAVVRSVLTYAGQVWGYKRFEEVEKLQIYFLKRIFRLPMNTPTYMLFIETGLPELYNYTLNQHITYMHKVMSLPDNRLPKIVASSLLRSNTNCVREWSSLCEQHGVPVPCIENVHEWPTMKQLLLNRLDESTHRMYEQRAQLSETRILYKTLNHTLNGNNYFNDKHNTSTISIIFKARGELLSLNYTPHYSRNNSNGKCEICNLQEVENTFHFIGACPILRELRVLHLGKHPLYMHEVAELLDGPNWVVLARYLKDALDYRRKILLGDF